MKKILIMASVMSFGVIAVNAAGTDYGTNIANSATLSYSVGGVAQTTVPSNTDTFVVDRKVDVEVATTDAVNVEVVPGDNIAPQDNNKALTFTVTNSSNGAQSYILDVSNLATGTATIGAGGTDNIDFTGDFKVCTDATCTGGNIAGTEIAFTEDQAITYYVFADIPTNTANDSRASIALTATAVNTGTTTPMTDDSGSADDAATVQVVFAEAAGTAGDAQYDGKHSALSAYEVVSATLTVVKSSCVLSDPVNAGTNPKRIPGAVIRYAIQIANTGSAAATNVSLADTIAAQYGTSAANLEVRTAACAGINAGTNACAARAGTVEPVGNTAGAGTNSVTLDYATVAAGTTECGYIEVTIQ